MHDPPLYSVSNATNGVCVCVCVYTYYTSFCIVCDPVLGDSGELVRVLKSSHLHYGSICVL